MKYITHTRFKDKALCGDVNIPALSICEERGGVVYYDGKPICLAKSQNGVDHFTQNTDGLGMERGRLTKAIQKALSRRDSNYQARWDKVWDDTVCQKYKRADHDDYWLWNAEFFNADIHTLRYIARLVGAKDGE